jgi:hypothetical protein
MNTGKLASFVVTVALPLVAFLVGLWMLTGAASAQESTPPADRPLKSTAIAIGVVEEEGEDGLNLVDLHGVEFGRRDGGNLRFFSEEYGYYNGAVRELSCLEGVITAKGSGGLTLPDGSHKFVVFEATFDTSSNAAEVTVKAKDEYTYTIEGTLEGLTYCGNLRDAPPTW